MPREISENLKNHLSNSVLTLAHCIKISLVNGNVQSFTNHDQPILFENLLYVTNGAFKPSAIYFKEGLAVDNVEISNLLNLDNISIDDVMRGDLNNSELEIFIINYEKPDDGKMLLFKGMIGEITLDRNKYTAQVRGLTQSFSNNIGSIYSSTCRANFCDERCKLIKSGFQFEGIVNKVTDERHLITSLQNDNDFFKNGTIEFISGKNSGQKFQIKNHFNSSLELYTKPYYKIYKNDKFIVTAGCDKSFSTCVTKFNNAINFRGEPHLPKLNN